MLAPLPSLSSALAAPARELLEAGTAAAEAAGADLWVVGGALRDCAAGRAVRDVDVATASADPTAAERLARSTAGRVAGSWEVTAEPRFGTASVRGGAGRLEVATLRTEHYARPGALPEVRLGATIEADLARRDFTVNALALAVAGPRRGELLDPFDGLEDLAARRLRALHARSFADDATRLWRGARYAAALDLRPEPATAQWIAEGARWLPPISGARLWAEFERTSAQRRVARTVRLLDAWGVLHGTHEGWSVSEAARRALRHRPGPHAPEVLLATLLALLPDRDAIAARLDAPRAARGEVDAAARLLALGGQTPQHLVSVKGVGVHARQAARWLEPARQLGLQRALRRWERTRSPLDAAALQRLGVPPGPELGAWLRRLRRERYLGTLGSAAAARRLVRSEPGREAGTDDEGPG
ncbi:MAG: CCA tRNA nucleotidyltransferase [Chloroflexi bacterium]|nr:CCA tRNA nucleotidyltransferase [Chloroflexota bacterium]